MALASVVEPEEASATGVAAVSDSLSAASGIFEGACGIGAFEGVVVAEVAGAGVELGRLTFSFSSPYSFHSSTSSRSYRSCQSLRKTSERLFKLNPYVRLLSYQTAPAQVVFFCPPAYPKAYGPFRLSQHRVLEILFYWLLRLFACER